MSGRGAGGGQKTAGRADAVTLRESLERLIDAAAYRAAVDRIFSEELPLPATCRKYFADVLVASARLYLNCPPLRDEISRAKTPPRKAKGPDHIESDSAREYAHRKLYRERLESLHCLRWFKPETNAFADAIDPAEGPQPFRDRRHATGTPRS